MNANLSENSEYSQIINFSVFLFCFQNAVTSGIMGLEKQYIKYGQSARDKIFGVAPEAGRKQGPTPLSMLISQGAKFNNSE